MDTEEGINRANNNNNNEGAEVENGRLEGAEFEREFVERHNELRKLHGSPELAHSEELSLMASDWANKLASRGHVSFAEISGIGECITVFPEEKGAREMVDYWYEENRKYEYDEPGWQEGTNYFSQIIWRSTKEIGVGRATMHRSPLLVGKEKKPNKVTSSVHPHHQRGVVVVAFYRPAGNSNRSGQFMLNVSKPVT